jgi:myo-inositol-1(or 4)-monophosphatase
MRRNLHSKKKINETSVHDIKLELDVRCQKLIERQLHPAFPHISFLGEEGDSGDRRAEYRWVVDPIDGTVNFTYGIPHACVSIALQSKSDEWRVTSDKRDTHHTSHVTLLGVVYDPFQDELWTAIRGQPARLNGKVIRVSSRRTLADAVVSIGFSKSRASMEHALPYFAWLTRRVRKIRMMGAAALGLTYVATGRFDAYIERGINLWDIAAGGLIVECAGGEFWHEPISGGKFRMIASNGLLGRTLRTGKFK